MAYQYLTKNGCVDIKKACFNASFEFLRGFLTCKTLVMDLHQHPSSPRAEDPDSGDNQRPIKNQRRIDEVRARMVVESKITILTSTMSRIMRKDWNIVSTKMYVHTLNPSIKMRVTEALAELNWEVADLQESATLSLFKNLDHSWLAQENFLVKVLSPESASWLRAVQSIDICIAKMMTAEKQGLLEKKQRLAALAGVNLAYTAFKYSAMNMAIPQRVENAMV
jgi:hypothetical protein